MSVVLILLLLGAGALIIPSLGGGDDGDDAPTDSRNEILGGPENDLNVQGSEGNDLIRTFLGNDEIFGNGGNDEIFAGEGDDDVDGGEGNDFVRGGAGNDEIFGDKGNDRIFADRGDDFVDGGRGSDLIRGGQGADTILGGVNSVLDENNLPISRSDAVDNINGEAGDDLIIAWGDGSTIIGGIVDDDEFDDNGSNNDTMVAASGDVVMSGQTGDNTVVALANLEDDTISTATVTDFDLVDDKLVLTVDYSSNGTPPPDYEPTFEIDFAIVDSETQGSGTLITITWTNSDELGVEPETSTTSESARAFLVGYPRDDDSPNPDPQLGLAGLRLEVYLTEDASYADPLATLDDLDGRVAPDAILSGGILVSPPSL